MLQWFGALILTLNFQQSFVLEESFKNKTIHMDTFCQWITQTSKFLFSLQLMGSFILNADLGRAKHNRRTRNRPDKFLDQPEEFVPCSCCCCCCCSVSTIGKISLICCNEVITMSTVKLNQIHLSIQIGCECCEDIFGQPNIT